MGNIDGRHRIGRKHVKAFAAFEAREGLARAQRW
jgi:hypothetical protein